MRWALCSWSGTGTDLDPLRPELAPVHGTAWGCFDMRRILGRDVCLYVEPTRLVGWGGAGRVDLAEVVDEPLGPAVRAAVETRLGVPCPDGSTIMSLMEDIALGEILPDLTGRLRMVVGGQPVFDRPVISGGALPATDTFDRANSLDLGADWTVATSACQIVSNRARGAGVEFWASDTFANAQYSKADVYVAGSGFGANGVTVRTSTTDSGTYYYARLCADCGDVAIGKRFNFSAADIAAGGTITTTTPFNHNVKLTADGSALAAFIDGSGTSAVSTSDSDITSGSAGFWNNAGNGSLETDNWEGGDLAVGHPAIKRMSGVPYAAINLGVW